MLGVILFRIGFGEQCQPGGGAHQEGMCGRPDSVGMRDRNFMISDALWLTTHLVLDAHLFPDAFPQA